MVRHFENETTFKFSWDQIARAFWQRYPNPYRYVIRMIRLFIHIHNLLARVHIVYSYPHLVSFLNTSNHVLSEDVVERFVNEEGNLYTKRLLKKESRPPKWAERFISARQVYIVEESIIEPKNQVIYSYTRNIGLQKYMTIDEKVVYRPCYVNPLTTTIAIRDAWIDSKFYGLARAFKAYGYERFKHNVKKATMGFQYVLEQMYHEPEMMTRGSLIMEAPRDIRDSLKDQAKRASSELAEFAKNRQIKIAPAVHKSTQ